MAGRGPTTYEKRRKELARKEKQRMKAERRAERAQRKGTSPRDEGDFVDDDSQSAFISEQSDQPEAEQA